jgi:hypothetical protein
MSRKIKMDTEPRTKSNGVKRSEKNAVIPVRLELEAYRELMGVKGLLINETRSNVSFSDAVSELVKVFYASRKNER